MPHDHATRIFIIRHKLPDFEGVMLGVDFCGGRGSTGSVQDAAVLMGLGCTIEDTGARAIVEAYAAGKKAEREKREADQKILWILESKPGDPWTKEKQAAREAEQQEREAEKRRSHKSSRWKRAHNWGGIK